MFGQLSNDEESGDHDGPNDPLAPHRQQKSYDPGTGGAAELASVRGLHAGSGGSPATIRAADRRDGKAAYQLSRQARINSGNCGAIVAASMALPKMATNITRTSRNRAMEEISRPSSRSGAGKPCDGNPARRRNVSRMGGHDYRDALRFDVGRDAMAPQYEAAQRKRRGRHGGTRSRRNLGDYHVERTALPDGAPMPARLSAAGSVNCDWPGLIIDVPLRGSAAARA